MYYEDTDAGGVVYYANYLKFMERARTEWLRKYGFEQTELLRDLNVMFVVHEVQIKYLKPAMFDDLLRVTVAVFAVSRSVVDFVQRVEREAVLVEARVKVVCVNGQTFKPVSIPDVIRQQIESEA